MRLESGHSYRQGPIGKGQGWCTERDNCRQYRRGKSPILANRKQLGWWPLKGLPGIDQRKKGESRRSPGKEGGQCRGRSNQEELSLLSLKRTFFYSSRI
jgi:hypothetical protein